IKDTRADYDVLFPGNVHVATYTAAYPGTDSPWGCGSNSRYQVTHTIVRTHVGDPSTPMPGKIFSIACRSSGLVLDVPGAKATPGAQVQQYPDNATVAQHWQLFPTGDGYFTIRSVINGTVLEVAGNSSADGAAIQLANLTDAHNQHWQFEQ